MANETADARRGGIGLWITAALVGLSGLLLTIGGVRLASLGGSLYYAIAGIALLACALLLLRRSALALYVMAALIVATLIWAVIEIGLDWWQMAPRGDVLFILGVLMLLPWVGRALFARDQPFWRSSRGALAGALVLASLVGLLAIVTPDGNEWAAKAARAPTAAALSEPGIADGDWPQWGRTLKGQHYSPLAQITPANAKDLKPAWTFHTGDLKGPNDPDEFTYEVTPIKVGDTLYLCSPHNIVFALDAETGKQRWKFDPHIRADEHQQHMTCRGVSWHDEAMPGSPKTGDCPQRIIMATNDARLIALDARTGQLCRSFGTNGQVDTRAGQILPRQGWFQYTSAPLVTAKLIVLGGSIYDNKAEVMPSGVIRAYDVATGKLVWNFDPGNPGSTAPLAPGQHYVPSTPNMWSTASADEALGMVYLPMGMGAIDQWGGKRTPAQETYASTILALDLATGRERWRYQTVHHDLWDMDVPAQPALVDIDVPGHGKVPALIQSTKTGNIFVLDRRTGTPIFPVEERKVPGGAAPGDFTAPTQPFSSATFFPDRDIREADMWGATTFDQLLCRIAFRGMRYEGPYTPPSLKGTLVFPGNFGVMDWGGMAYDPVRQIAFAHPNYMAFVDQLTPQSEVPANPDATDGGSQKPGLNPNKGAPFAVYLNPFLSKLGLPCQAPPWGYVAGMDLRTGKVIYRHKNGTIQDESPIPLPIKMGVPSLGGPLVTAGGVAFLGSALDYYLRAYDTATGELLWQARLPNGGQANPMTYLSPASGRQFVVIASGGHGSLGTAQGDAIIAYALPKAA
jgi:quinoprotein glucose dehydrogenase